MKFEIQNRGTIRGGLNYYGRFHFIIQTGFSNEENEALLPFLRDRFSISKIYVVNCCENGYIIAQCDNRRELAIIPAVIRYCELSKFDYGCSMHDILPYPTSGHILVSNREDLFWREYALSMAYYKE